MTPLERIFDRAVPEPNSGCFLWPGAVDQSGYGRVMIKGKCREAHRLAFEVFEGPIPEGRCVLHKCDVRCCVNPKHLFLGSRRDNIVDMDRKGRRTVLSGPSHGNSKLSVEAVQEIRAELSPVKTLVAKYGVTKRVIYNVLRGLSYRGVP